MASFFSFSFVVHRIFHIFTRAHFTCARSWVWAQNSRFSAGDDGKSLLLDIDDENWKKKQTKLENFFQLSTFFHPHQMLVPANSNSISRLTNHFTSIAASRQLVDICRSSSFTYLLFYLFALLVLQLILLANCSFCTLHKLIDCWLLRADWFYMCILNQLRGFEWEKFAKNYF